MNTIFMNSKNSEKSDQTSQQYNLIKVQYNN